MCVLSVSKFVSETSSVSLLDAVSVDKNWPLDDTLSVVDPSPSPPPCPSIKPSPPLSSEVRPSASTSTAGGWSEGDSGRSRTMGVPGSDPGSDAGGRGKEGCPVPPSPPTWGLERGFRLSGAAGTGRNFRSTSVTSGPGKTSVRNSDSDPISKGAEWHSDPFHCAALARFKEGDNCC